MTKTVEESEFAEQATALLHEVTANGDEVVITRDGKIMARVVPAEPRYGPMHGRAKIIGDLEEPIEER